MVELESTAILLTLLDGPTDDILSAGRHVQMSEDRHLNES